MAPIPEAQSVQEEIKNVIQDLLQVMAQVSNYDSAGRPSRDALAADLQSLDASLQAVHRTATAMQASPSQTPSPSLPAGAIPIGERDVGIPETLIHYVENGRNPDIYTREFVELVRRMNQLARGKLHAFSSFRDVLAHEMEAALPELRDDIRRVVEATGGPGNSSGSGGAGPSAQQPVDTPSQPQTQAQTTTMQVPSQVPSSSAQAPTTQTQGQQQGQGQGQLPVAREADAGVGGSIP